MVNPQYSILLVQHVLQATEQPKNHGVYCLQLTDRRDFVLKTLVIFEAANIHFQPEPHWEKDDTCVAAAKFEEIVHTYELVGVTGGGTWKWIPISRLFA